MNCSLGDKKPRPVHLSIGIYCDPFFASGSDYDLPPTPPSPILWGREGWGARGEDFRSETRPFPLAPRLAPLAWPVGTIFQGHSVPSLERRVSDTLPSMIDIGHELGMVRESCERVKQGGDHE